MIKFYAKNFSIEDGGYKGGKRATKSGGYLGSALIGGGIGAIGGALVASNNKKTDVAPTALVCAGIGMGIGALVNWMSNVADKSEFNTGRSNNCNSYLLIQTIEDYYKPAMPDEDETTVSSTETDSRGRTVTVTRRQQVNKKEVTSSKGVVYDVDGDPNKYVMTLLYQGNVLVMYLNRPNRNELNTLNSILNSYCFAYKNADYASEKVGKESYMIDMNIISDTEQAFMMSLIKSGFKINILTKSRLGMNKR